MRKNFKLETEIEVEETELPNQINAARACYAQTGGITEYPDGKPPRNIPSDEAVASPEGALMELIQSNPLLRSAGADVVSLSCSVLTTVGENGPVPGVDLDRPGEDYADDSQNRDLDEFQPGVYLSRWPNGEFSVVMADSKRDAVVALDEWAAAHPSSLTMLDSCMLDFGLSDLGEIELRQIGETTSELIWDRCYPALRKVLLREDVASDNGGEYSEQAKEIIRAAVEHEKQRLWDDQPADPAAETELGRELQQQLGTGGAVADKYVKDIARRLLKSKLGEGGKPN